MTPTSKLSQVATGVQRCKACGRNKPLAEYPLGRNHMPLSRCSDCLRENLARARAIRAKNGPKPLPTHEMRAGELKALGIRGDQIAELVKSGRIKRVRRGVYDRQSVGQYIASKAVSKTAVAPVVPQSTEVRSTALQSVLLKLEGASLLEPRIAPLVKELREALA